MEWVAINRNDLEFDENIAMEGDMYCFHNGKLMYVCNTTEDRRKKTVLERIKSYFLRKRNGNIVTLDRRTLEYIYNVCKGVMPPSKDEFVRSVLGAMKFD